ncbi:Protein kinase domain [Geosmithia morbida]|uniref:EKC/KEOPS complex subunit BUD32 n=1 Tax=Geosmithia morbida TaxID=1094350 RepID=A0A9P4YS18_9HYPO|nr:Protein kinase domain [Geosmithia morbida]KAF4120787.1 Protein kinase domain [Geosmithia morbida]
MELWVFDRSGAYSSGPFNIHEKPDQFAGALVGYATMDGDERGLDTFIERTDRNRHFVLNDPSGNILTIRLSRPIVRQKAIVCRGTTCYATQDGQVAKFSWVSDKRTPEADLLKLAQERGVEGVPKLVAYDRITSVRELRAGLAFPQRHRFRDEDSSFKDLPSTTGQKRRWPPESASDGAAGSKRCRLSSQDSGRLQEINSGLSIKNTPSLHTTDSELWENRVYSCLVVSPAGRVLSQFKTARELLEALRDAIKAHRSLYINGDILHRDVSPNNIIITRPETTGFNGMLIDLDQAKVGDGRPSGAQRQTGTVQFMALEVLRSVDHTYRHDLESFLYVLIWMCARQSWNNALSGVGEMRPRTDLLRNWEVGSFEEIASTKMGHVTVDGMDNIMDAFPEALDIVKPLCLRLRRILFPLGEDERMNFGTPSGDPDQLYGPIMEAYNDTISKL